MLTYADLKLFASAPLALRLLYARLGYSTLSALKLLYARLGQ